MARAAAADDIHRWQLGSIELRNIPDMHHVGEADFRNLDGKRFNFAGPDRFDAISDSGKRKAANAVKQTSKRQLRHTAAAFATVFVMLIAVWAV